MITVIARGSLCLSTDGLIKPWEIPKAARPTRLLLLIELRELGVIVSIKQIDVVH